MKKITTLLMLAALALSLVSCAGTGGDTAEDTADYGAGLSGIQVPDTDSSTPDTGGRQE